MADDEENGCDEEKHNLKEAWVIQEPSAKVKQLMEARKAGVTQDSRGFSKTPYPFDTLECGQSLGIPRSRMKFNTLKSYAYKKGKQLGFKFIVYDHGEGSNYYEVFRAE